MLTAPYSIYVSKRPVRVAFLIEDKPESLRIVDNVLAYNRDLWGGRYNPLIITDGETLTDAWWSLLEAVDPDVVKSFVTLSDELIANIERRISPYLIQQPDRHEQEDGYRHIRVSNDGLSFLPTQLVVRTASRAIGESSLVLFETDGDKTDPLIKRFVEWNWGGYSRPTMEVSRALEDVLTETYQVTDAASLVAPLTELSTFRTFTYPIQLCSVPVEALPPVRHNPEDNVFYVVIGNAPLDVACFWNRPATTSQWGRTRLNQAWIPVDVATNALLTAPLNSWLKRSADRIANGQGRIRFVSMSLSQERLQEVVAPITCNLHVVSEVKALREIQPPKISEEPGSPAQDKMDLYRGTSTTERLTFQEPEVLRGPTLGDYWMADLYIEFRPERYPNIIGRPLWWQFPRMNGLARRMFQRPSRILRTRYPSVLMKLGEPRLDIALLDDISIFATLAAAPSELCYTSDARYKETIPGRTPYYQASRSDKGRYLSGFIDLFGGLYPASRYLKERYWRCMFDLLSGRTAHKDAERLKVVENTMRKRLGADPAQFYKDDEVMRRLAYLVLTVARGLPASSRDLEFLIFEEQAKQEMEDFNARRVDQEPWEYSREDLLNALADLTDRGVLLIGVKARCPSCGYRAWHHIDDAKQTLRCGGCNAAFPMPPEQRWHYRLNSLARAAHAQHGLLPVVLVLGQLLMDARSAFLFAPCLDLFENDDDGPVGDLDIAVILDGQFMIGEVKQSRKLFSKATFANMEGIARRLLPDVLLFASMDRELTGLIDKEIARLSEELRPLDIAVQWYQLRESTFHPSPVM